MSFLSLCVYTDRAEPELENALKRATQDFDEVCLVDLSSDGEALAVGQACGALTCRYRWSDQRSEALNAGLQLSSGDWTLLATVDEVLEGVGEGLRSRELEGVVALGREAQVGPLRLPAQRGIPAGGSFRGRDAAQLDPPAEHLWKLPGMEEAFFESVVQDVQNTESTERSPSVQEDAPSADAQAASGATEVCQAAYERGLELYHQGDHEAAIDELVEAVDNLSLDVPFSAHLLETVSYCLRALGRKEEAYDLLSQVAGNFPDRVDTQFLMALLALDNLEFEEAELGFQRCLTLANTIPEGGPSEAARGTYVALHNLGALRETLDMQDEALEYYRRALAKNPFYSPSREAVDRLEAALAGTQEPSVSGGSEVEAGT